MLLQNINNQNKNGEEERIPKTNSTVYFNRRLSVAEKLQIIKNKEERNIHVASNYYGVSKSTIR